MGPRNELQTVNYRNGLRPHTGWISILVLTAIAGATDAPSAETTPADDEHTVAEWIEIVQREAQQWYAKETPAFAAIRLAAGWSMPGLSGRKFQTKEVADEWPAFEKWLNGTGYDLLGRILKGERLAPHEGPYRPIALGLYLRAGLDYEKTEKPNGRAVILDLSKLPGGRDACLAYRKQVEEDGRKALYKGYVTGRLSRQDIEAIRLYRIAQGQRVVGESFLPCQLGLHPLGDGQLEGHWGSGHGMDRIVALVHGKPFYDVRLRRLEAVLQSKAYSDKLDTSYHLTYALRPEGVLDFVRILNGYEPFKNDSGATVVRLKPELLEPRLGERPGDSVRLKDRIGPKPVVLYINDPIDGPVSEQFPAFETFCQAYRDQVDCWFVAVDIHDWYYSGMPDLLSYDKPGQYPNIHSYSQEERARKAKNRYLESPHATFPCLIGDDWQSVKNYYGTGGGANHWLVFDRNGVLAEYTANQNGNLNHVETAVRRVLANNGRMAEDSQAHLRWGDPASAPNVVEPANRRMRVHDAEVISVEPDKGVLSVKKKGLGPDDVLPIRLKPFARVSRDEVLAQLSDVKPGERVAIDFYLDDYIDTKKATEEELKALSWGSWRREYRLGDQRLEMTLLGHYGTMRRRWYVDEIAQPTPLPVRGIRVLNAAQQKDPCAEPEVMWLCGHVTAVDATSHRITVKRTPLTAETARGYAFYREIQEQKQHITLTEAARLRLAEVEKWLSGEQGDATVLADDAVDYSLNGAFGGGFEAMAVGDFVGIRYYPDRQKGELLVPHTIRISKPVTAKGNGNG